MEAVKCPEADEGAQRRELMARAVALPAALFAAFIAVNAWPAPVRLLTMWVHESGHAVTALLCGYSAFPSAWITPVSESRSPCWPRGSAIRACSPRSADGTS